MYWLIVFYFYQVCFALRCSELISILELLQLEGLSQLEYSWCLIKIYNRWQISACLLFFLSSNISVCLAQIRVQTNDSLAWLEGWTVNHAHQNIWIAYIESYYFNLSILHNIFILSLQIVWHDNSSLHYTFTKC